MPNYHTISMRVVFWIGLVAALLTVGGFLNKFWTDYLDPYLNPWVTIMCPPQIDTHEHVLFGEHNAASGDHKVRLYVYPEDGSVYPEDKYWLADLKRDSYSGKAWVNWARFGNPYGEDMVKKPPLYFRVYAALIESEKVDKLPGSSSKNPYITTKNETGFRGKVIEAGALAVSAPCRILRVPEPGPCPMPSIISPNKQEVTSPVRLSWTPKIRMYVQLYKGGAAVIDRFMKSDETLELQTGRYELKVTQHRGTQCSSGFWFYVVEK